MPNFDLNSGDFDYFLPNPRIAQEPLSQRDDSKLLVYKQKGQINDDYFYRISDYLPENSLLVFNETRVIRARMEFVKETGAVIEVFCLEPNNPSKELSIALDIRKYCEWKCFVGNAKKWKSGKLKQIVSINNLEIELLASNIENTDDGFIVGFEWEDENISFSQIIEAIGHTPLPPYIKRESTETDTSRYQTIYAQLDGSVAAPTAGLHFTEKVLKSISDKNILQEKVVLHVGAGTFKPLKDASINEHTMHAETIIISLKTINCFIANIDKNIINVGTTTVRTLESLYWHGVKLIVDKNDNQESISINQWDPYNEKYNIGISALDSLIAIRNYMTLNKMAEICGLTQLMIIPGYEFKLTNIIITNFHQPKSTLLLLVSAFTNQNWREIYQYAMDNDYRFLSYGDSCLLLNRLCP
ncbi:MAG: S-adenosylmethionine:tRNA ribosyltransferase-isomerase [Bacteroidota bacterium]